MRELETILFSIIEPSRTGCESIHLTHLHAQALGSAARRIAACQIVLEASGTADNLWLELAHAQ